LQTADEIGTSALEAVILWNAYRNLLVHQQGHVGQRFVDRYAKTWDSLFQTAEHIGELRRTQQLPLFHDAVVSCGLAVYRTCLFLSDHLCVYSEGRRGHPFAPGAVSDAAVDEGLRAPQLLLAGDHGPSLAWAEDADYRRALWDQARA
jgi:hypothetical protein